MYFVRCELVFEGSPLKERFLNVSAVSESLVMSRTQVPRVFELSQEK